jgi:ubiquinone/menaquinone biosynthesis C-methylase UbiE
VRRVCCSSGINADFFNYKNLPHEEFLKNFYEKFNVPENRDIATCAHTLVNSVFAAHAHLGPGATVVDFGAGTGLLLPLLCESVGPTGKVIGTEISKQFCEHLQEKIAQSKGTSEDLDPHNVVSLVLTTNQQLNLSPHYDHAVDTVIICDVYHHLEFPKTMMRQVHKILKPITGRSLCPIFFGETTYEFLSAECWYCAG